MKFILSILFVFSANLAHAKMELAYLGGGLLATEIDASCAQSSDQYESPTRYTENSINYADLCIDTDRYRSAKILEDNKDVIKFANYMHDGEYWIAEISKKAVVEQLYFQIVRFDVVSGITAAHTQFRIRFKKGSEMKLTSQVSAAKQIEINDIVISYEAARPVGIPYNFALGAFNNYALVARPLSGAQRQAESTKQATEQYTIELANNKEKLQFLISAIRKSDEMGSERIYNTIRPNCTTEVFDLLDQVPSVKKTNPVPFLTVISNNPIAAPSLKALSERGVLVGKSPDLIDELQNDDFTGPKPVSPEQMAGLSFLTVVDGYDYSMIDVSTKDIPEARQLVYDAAPGLLQTIGASAMTVTNAEQMMAKGLKDLAVYLQSELEKINDKLPVNEAKYVRLYFAPWNAKGKEIEPLISKGVPARLPFKTYELPEDGKGLWLASGFTYLSDIRFKESDKPYFKGASLILKLQKDYSEAKIQVLVGLQPRTLDQEFAKNEQVHLNQLVVPEAASRSYRPVVLANLTAAYQEKPQLNLEFGADGGLKPGSLEFQMFKTIGIGGTCERQAESVPTLKGTFGPNAHGSSLVSGILKGSSVNLSIFSVEMDVEAQEVTNVDIRISNKWPIKCMKDGSVDQQFSDEVNAKLSEIKADLAEKGSENGSWLKMIGQFISQAEEGDFSGLE